MDYEKAYKEALERARQGLPIDEIFPELKDSEDEKIRKELVEFITTIKDISESGRRELAICTSDAEMCKRFLAYLEKKQQPEPIEPISKCSKNWLNDGRVLSYGLNDLEQVIHRGFLSAGVDVSFEIIKETAKECLSLMKPAEWSEEDEKMMKFTLQFLDYHKLADPTAQSCKDWLKSIRPQPHWKPSGEQMLALGGVLDYLEESDNEDADIIRELINDLKKL